MQLPKYYFCGEFKDLEPMLKDAPHADRIIHKDEFLWNSGEYINKVYYIRSGAAMCYVEHEGGYRKILQFIGDGFVYPGCHNTQFKIEKSILVRALTELDTMEFDRAVFYELFLNDRELNARMFETYAEYINLLIYEAAHQDYNSSLVKVCNLLHLYLQCAPDVRDNRIRLTQEEIADILTINRVNLSKYLTTLKNDEVVRLHRGSIEILDVDRLRQYCSEESRN